LKAITLGGETTDVGYTAGSYTFRLGRLKLSPAFGILFGSYNTATSPAVSLRWGFERAWFVTEGLGLLGFRRTPVFAEGEGEPGKPPEPVSYVLPMISDGSHVSERWKRMTLGGTWEHIHFREGSEWKGGGRLVVRILPRASLALYVLAPGKTEWRGGILIHPAERD